ncbi:AraC family transcriptional regulator [Mycolicibacterium sediminis]|uniref:Transcriptional regulator n=1 Tax=Mycolicibacterium sediminis TaxID=1286180 RepID=A0A7I7R0S6_9MYCO|nr:AraC family transcriptional regulator [Mycolicibacterium sediminis]BBY31766.1 transcriptional regulator [Mycolicibacterium sediminis]
MVEWDVPRSGSGALVMIDLARERGLTVENALRDTGLTMSRLSDRGSEISTRQEFAVVGNVVEALGDPPGLGVEAGSRFQLPLYGTFAFALISSATVRAAVDTLLRSIILTFAFSSVARAARDGRTAFTFTANGIPSHLRRFVVERDVAGLRRLQREVFADPPPLPVEFAFPAPDDAGVYDDAFGVRPLFGVAESAVVADDALLDLPMPQANEQVLALALEQCSVLLERRRPLRETGRLVRDILVRNLGSVPDARLVARELHVSDRTLRHRLAAEGTSFRALVEEVRERFAEEFLAGGMAVAEIAERLGYRELSSFSQAFRRWKGVGPREYRRLSATARVR